MDVRLSIQAAAKENPNRTALRIDGATVSFAELADAARDVKASLAGASFVPILATPSTLAVATALAALEAGIPFVPLRPTISTVEREEQEALLEAELGTAVGSASEEAPMAVLFTSGSTGSPRGVVLSRRAFLASARASEKNLGWRDGDGWLSPLSWAHIGGLSVLVRCLIGRRTAVLTTSRTSLATSIAHPSVTLASLVPPMLDALLGDPAWHPPEQLRAILLGGGPASPALLEKAKSRGVPVMTTYGMTETCSQVATASLAESCPPGAVGRPISGISVSIETGQICVAGPVVMNRYLGGPTLEGVFRTGDLGHIVDGWLYVTGRRGDRINSGGVRVDPTWVESVLQRVTGIRQACVFGIPDPTWGEVVAVAVVLEAPLNERSAPAAVREFCSTALESPMRPRRLAVATALPTTASGKVSRKLARERFGEQLRTLRYRS